MFYNSENIVLTEATNLWFGHMAESSPFFRLFMVVNFQGLSGTSRPVEQLSSNIIPSFHHDFKEENWRWVDISSSCWEDVYSLVRKTFPPEACAGTVKLQVANTVGNVDVLHRWLNESPEGCDLPTLLPLLKTWMLCLASTVENNYRSEEEYIPLA